MDQSRTSQHRLKRKALWAALWLAKLIRFMADVLRLPPRVVAYVERRLDLLADFVVHLILIRAAAYCRPGQRQRNRFAAARAAARHDVRARITHSMRATIGGQLRRALKARGPDSKKMKARAEAILQALQNIDRLTARFVRRMKKGLSRRVSLHTRILRPSHAEALCAKVGLASVTPRQELRAVVAPP